MTSADRRSKGILLNFTATPSESSKKNTSFPTKQYTGTANCADPDAGKRVLFKI
jgi:hypothetical protein